MNFRKGGGGEKGRRGCLSQSGILDGFDESHSILLHAVEDWGVLSAQRDKSARLHLRRPSVMFSVTCDVDM